jgi:hypothetical protein
MAYTKYSLTPANNNAAPPDGAPEGMLPSAVNDTMRDMMAQIRDVGDGIRGGTYTMTAPVITGGSVTGSTINNSAIGGTTAAAGAFTTLGATGVATFSAGTVSAPAITTTGDTNTGIYFPAADTIAFTEGGVESMRIDSSGNVGIGTATTTERLRVQSSSNYHISFKHDSSSSIGAIGYTSADNVLFYGNGAERMRLDASGFLLVGKIASNLATVGAEVREDGLIYSTVTTGAGSCFFANRQSDDGVLVSLRQANTQEGTISVSGTTVSYNGGHLSRWSQLIENSKDESILKGTVLSNLDEMCIWEKDGVVAGNEQLNKMKVSDVEGDTNVAGVFVNWTRDEDYNSDDMNIAMTGDMIIRIADGVVVQKGDLLMSAGDGTAKPQGDDIVRSKTIAKVTSNYITCTYADGSYCVPCVLMAC